MTNAQRMSRGRNVQGRQRRWASEIARVLRASTWAPPRRQLIPAALPKRFIEGVAWDEV